VVNWHVVALESVLREVSSAWLLGNVIVADAWGFTRCLTLSLGSLVALGGLSWDGSSRSWESEDGSAKGNGFSGETHFEDVSFVRGRRKEKEIVEWGEDGRWMWMWR
jgi:hypothetical protein